MVLVLSCKIPRADDWVAGLSLWSWSSGLLFGTQRWAMKSGWHDEVMLENLRKELGFHSVDLEPIRLVRTWNQLDSIFARGNLAMKTQYTLRNRHIQCRTAAVFAPMDCYCQKPWSTLQSIEGRCETDLHVGLLDYQLLKSLKSCLFSGLRTLFGVSLGWGWSSLSCSTAPQTRQLLSGHHDFDVFGVKVVMVFQLMVQSMVQFGPHLQRTHFSGTFFPKNEPIDSWILLFSDRGFGWLPGLLWSSIWSTVTWRQKVTWTPPLKSIWRCKKSTSQCNDLFSRNHGNTLWVNEFGNLPNICKYLPESGFDLILTNQPPIVGGYTAWAWHAPPFCHEKALCLGLLNRHQKPNVIFSTWSFVKLDS